MKIRGRPVRSKIVSSIGGGSDEGIPKPSRGIHLIGNTLVVNTNELSVEEVVFVGGKAPKVR